MAQQLGFDIKGFAAEINRKGPKKAFGGFMMSLGAMTWDLFKIRLKNSKDIRNKNDKLLPYKPGR